MANHLGQGKRNSMNPNHCLAKHAPLMVLATLMMNHSIAYGQIAEIIVTAQKRQANLQDVPVAVQSVSASQLENAGVKNVSQLQHISPGFVANDTQGQLLPYIRGIGSTSFGNGVYSSVAIYSDDVFNSRISSSFVELDNVEQIQVLKGPQGALFGRNATGGALVITTQTPFPSDEAEGQISASVGNFSNRSVSASFRGGISETTAGSISLLYRKRDGFVDNLSGDDLDDKDTFAAAAKFVYQPSDTTEIVFGISYDEADDRAGVGNEQLALTPDSLAFGLSGAQQFIFANLAAGACPGAGFADIQGIACSPAAINSFLATAVPLLPDGSPNPLFDLANAQVVGGLAAAAGGATFSNSFGEVFGNQLGAFENGFFRGEGDVDDGSFTYTEDLKAHLKATFSFDRFDWISISSFGKSKYELSSGLISEQPGSVVGAPGPLPGTAFGFSADFVTDTYTQELQLLSSNSAIEWVAGVYYFREKGDSLIAADIFGTSVLVADNTFRVDAIAAFGQVRFPITDAISITGGVRYTSEDYELADDFPVFEITAFSNLTSQPGLPNAGSQSESFNETTGTLIIDYKFEDVLLYASLATGFKSGVLNATNPSLPGVDPEEIISYEVGFKSDLADGRIRLNGAAFYYDYENIHLNVIDSNSGAQVLINGSEADVLGAEIELNALITEALSINASITVLDSEYKQNVNQGPFQLPISGNSLVSAPDTSLAIGVEYVQPMDNAELSFVVTGSYNSGMYYTAEQAVGSGGLTDDSFGLVNANLTYAHESGWSASLWANNLTDEEYYRGGVLINGLSRIAQAGQPRHYGMTVRYKF